MAHGPSQKRCHRPQTCHLALLRVVYRPKGCLDARGHTLGAHLNRPEQVPEVGRRVVLSARNAVAEVGIWGEQPAGWDTNTSEADALRHELAKTDLYRGNGFRVLGLPLDAGARDIGQRLERMRSGENGDTGLRLLGPTPALKPSQIEAAAGRLGTPEVRLRDELFWFWPYQNGSPATDPALQALAAGNSATATEIWASAAQTGDDIALHNLAVLNHALALDAHFAGLGGPEQCTAAEYNWRQALEHWNSLCQRDAFWASLMARSQELGVGQAGPLVAGLHSTILPAMLEQLARLCLMAALNQQEAACALYRELREGFGFDAERVSEALHDVLHTYLDDIDKKVRKADEDASAAPESAERVAQTLMEGTRRPLYVVDRVLGEGHPWRDYARDDVAEAANSCVMQLHNSPATRSSLAVLRTAAELAVDPRLRGALADNLEMLERDVAEREIAERGEPPKGSEPEGQEEAATPAGAAASVPAPTPTPAPATPATPAPSAVAAQTTCFYCQARLAEDEHARACAVSHGQTQETVAVPRCAECAQVHAAMARGWSVPGAVTGALVGTALQTLIAGELAWPDGGGPLAMIGFLVDVLLWQGGGLAALALGAIGAWLGPRSQPSTDGIAANPEAMTSEYPRIKELVAQGWQVSLDSAAPALARKVLPVVAAMCAVLAIWRLGEVRGQRAQVTAAAEAIESATEDSANTDEPANLELALAMDEELEQLDAPTVPLAVRRDARAWREQLSKLRSEQETRPEGSKQELAEDEDAEQERSREALAQLLQKVLDDVSNKRAQAAKDAVTEALGADPNRRELQWLNTYLEAYVAGNYGFAEVTARYNFKSLSPKAESMRERLAELATTHAEQAHAAAREPKEVQPTRPKMQPKEKRPRPHKVIKQRDIDEPEDGQELATKKPGSVNDFFQDVNRASRSGAKSGTKKTPAIDSNSFFEDVERAPKPGANSSRRTGSQFPDNPF